MRILVVTNMYPSKARPASGTFVEQQVKGLIDAGVKVELVVVDREGKGRSAYFGLAQMVSETATVLQCDLVHVMYGGVMAKAAASVAYRSPVIVSLCGDDILGTVGKWPLAPLRSWLNKAASINACKRADGVVVKSKNLARAITPYVNPAKVHVIPNGIDMERFRPLDRADCARRLGWSPDAFHVVFPLNGDPAVKRLHLADQSIQLARNAGLALEFHPMQGIPHEDVPWWLNAGDVLLLTSQHEGSPNIVKEALACETPIVSVDVGDVAERIAGLAGCHLVTDDPTLIALKLQAVAGNRRRAQSRARVMDLSLPKVAERLKFLYEAVLKTRRNSKENACVG